MRLCLREDPAETTSVEEQIDDAGRSLTSKQRLVEDEAERIKPDADATCGTDLGCISYGNYSYLALDNILHSVLWESFPQ